MYRSVDGGRTWANATLGFAGQSSTNFTADPNNVNRVYCLSNGGGGNRGVHYSDDGGCSWEPCFMHEQESSHKYNQRLAVDETSFDESLGVSGTVYWLSLCKKDMEDVPHGLFKTVDGGANWALVKGTEQFANGEMVCAANGYVYVRTPEAIYRSKNGGESFEKIYEGAVGSICVVRTAPESIFALVSKVGLIVSHDCGDTFTVVTEGEFDVECPKYLRVAPSDHNFMVMEDDHLSDYGKWKLEPYYSHDGGKTWHRPEIDRQTGFFMPYNSRQTIMSFHPTDKNLVLSLGADAIVRSEDGGKTFGYSSTGYNGVCIGHTASFNVHDGNLVAVPAQDYNGGFSTDGGYTWNYVKWLDKPWGGHAYGSYIVDEQTVVACSSDGWVGRATSKCVAATFDGGKTVKLFEDCPVNGRVFSNGSAKNSDVVFCCEWRSEDRARSWQKMDGCISVTAVDNVDGTLVGIGENSRSAVISRDDGITWDTIAAFDCYVRDVAYNRNTGHAFVVLDEKLLEIDLDTHEMVERETGTFTLVSVCIDPVNTDVMYVCGNNDFDYNFNSVVRSVDGGKTWSTLHRQPGDGRKGPDGAKKPGLIRVNPTTRELWAFTWCYGVWKIAPPQGF
jgi:photosystem II stability/assembly factor-like uncharacterized protein